MNDTRLSSFRCYYMQDKSLADSTSDSFWAGLSTVGATTTKLQVTTRTHMPTYEA